MSKWIRWTPKQEALWDKWLSERPHVIQQMAKEFNLRFDNLYTLKTTGQRVILHSLDEDETVKVHVLFKFNPERMIASFQDRTVFGINPADLEICEDWTGEPEDGAPYEDLEDENESEGKNLH